MKAKVFLCALFALTLLACNPNEPVNKSGNLNIIYKGKSPYIDWYMDNTTERFVSCAYKAYPQDSTTQNHVFANQAEDIVVTLKNNMRIRLHDEYEIKNDGKITHLQLIRKGTILEDANNPKRIKADTEINWYVHNYSLNSAKPIELKSPRVDSCNPIPECSCDNFKIQWNADSTNRYGVAVIAEWSGVTAFESPQDAYIQNMDIIPDTGEAILNPDLFKNMPDYALVNIWLYRAELAEIDEHASGDPTLEEAMKESPEVFKEMLSNDPNLIMQMRSFKFTSSAVTGFSTFLKRE